MSDNTLLNLVAVVCFLLAAILVGTYIYQRRDSGSRQALKLREELQEQKKREKEEATSVANEEEERKSEEWAKENPRTHALGQFLVFGAFAVGAFWMAPDIKVQWKSTAVYLAGVGSALVAMFNFLAILFTPSGAGKLLLWLIGGGCAVWLIGSAIESTKGTVILGFLLVIWVILKGVEEIKKEIRE